METIIIIAIVGTSAALLIRRVWQALSHDACSDSCDVSIEHCATCPARNFSLGGVHSEGEGR